MNHRTAAAGPDTVVVCVMAVAVAADLWLWGTGEIAGRLASGGWPDVPLVAAAGVVARLPRHLSDPRLAWPAGARVRLPGPLAIYSTATVIIVPAAAGVWRWRRSRPPHPDRRGADWATSADLRDLRVGRRRPNGRLVLGQAPGPVTRRVATESRHSVLAIGPTQSGKTSALAIPAILEWRGPVVATSVKGDLVSTTLPARSRAGPSWVFDPTRSLDTAVPAHWSPLTACGTWPAAQKSAAWLVDATPARAGMADAAFWYSAAAKQLAPLLLAAARSAGTMADIVRWTNASDFDEPLTALHLAGESDAALALQACANRDTRILSSVATTLETVLAPFEDPTVAAITSSSDVDLDALFGWRGTLYLCGPSHEQQRVQGLFATLVSTVVDDAIRRVATSGRPLDPPLLLVLDEAANIAPIRDLDTLASTAAGFGIQLVTVCQDLAQLAARYGPERSRTIANNHRAKLLLSGVSDLTTLDLVSGLAGETALPEETVTHDLRDGRRTTSRAVAFRRLAPTDALRRIPPTEAVLVYGHLPPARIRLRPWYQDRVLSRAVEA